MNKQKYQSGFAHILIITIILGLGLVGTLGFVYYQNFIQKKDTVVKTDEPTSDKTPTVITPTDSDTVADAATNEGYLVIDDWGVKFKLPADLGDKTINYYKNSLIYFFDSESSYSFSTKGSEALGGRCSPSYGNDWLPLGSITKSTTSSQEQTNGHVMNALLVAQLDGYNYQYYGAQASCLSDFTGSQVDSQTDLLVQDGSLVLELVKSLQKK